MNSFIKYLTLLGLIVTVHGTLESFGSNSYTIKTGTGSVKVPKSSLQLGDIDPSMLVGKLIVTAHVDSHELLRMNPSPAANK